MRIPLRPCCGVPYSESCLPFCYTRKNPAAVALGKIKSVARAKASRENGKLGGRPKKPKRIARRHNSVLGRTEANHMTHKPL